jgi:hypothetical protein
MGKRRGTTLDPQYRRRYKKSMSPIIQRIARTWFLPLSLLILSPWILGRAWTNWRRN